MIQPTQQALDALQIALKLELDSVAFYQKATKKALNRLGKETFASLIKEEMGHIEIVKKAYTSISEAKNWNEVAPLIPEKIDASKKNHIPDSKERIRPKT